MSAARPNFPYAHRTIAQIDAACGAGTRRSQHLFGEADPFPRIAAAEAGAAASLLARSGPGTSLPTPQSVRPQVRLPDEPKSGRTPASGRRGEQGCWAERSIAIRDAARRHLEGCSFVVQRKSLNDLVPSWSVSHFSGWFSTEQLIQLAVEYGFKPEAVQL